MRRTPEATALSPVTEIRPISPVRRTWVPPHSSTDQPSAFCPRSRGPLAHRDHADFVAVFFAEQRACAGFAGVVHPHQARGDLVILQHHVVGDVLDAGELFRRDRLRMHEVEAQAIRRDQRAALGDMIAEHLPQRLVQQMRRRVMGADRGAPRVIDFELQRGAELQRALLHRAEMHEEIAGLLLRIGDAEFDALAGHHAGVADLAAGLRIERRLVQHDRAGLAGLEAVGFLAVLDQRRDHAFGALGLIAQEFGGAELLAQRKPDRSRSRYRPSPSMTRAPWRCWRSIASVKDAWSTLMPRDFSASCVKSSGKP